MFSFICLDILQIRVSAVLTNGAFLLNVDCDHYFNNSKALKEAMCFLMDPVLGKKVCYVQFPQRFDGIDMHDRYANRNIVFFDVRIGSVIIGLMGFLEYFVMVLLNELIIYSLCNADQLERAGWASGSGLCGNRVLF